ncbi:hypothetical protein AB0I28_02600 [Phytomonospora sp. NPDC050363]|uniref:hypothetical protein n=1 Tax=Phytomonospora sp. NPDC050363 TaxID=3155642 RepID=UPI0033E440D3
MGLRIRAVGVEAGTGGTGVSRAASAVRRALDLAGLSTVHTLVNVGVYRDANLIEPAVAALVQQESGLHLDYLDGRDGPPLMSFDLLNGACGLLTAVHLADALTGTGEATLIVSGDGHPSGEPAVGFPYTAAAAAMVLDRADGGFGPVAFRPVREEPGVRGYLDLAAAGDTGRATITVERDPALGTRLAEQCAVLAAEHLAGNGLRPGEADIVTMRPTPGFGAELAGRLGVSPARVHVPAADTHTSALAVAFGEALTGGRFEPRERPVLFLAADAGVLTACALYRHDR